ncbi:MAG: FAD-dependent oxidoreductase, partial [Kiritimatiellae bacterium]|nr:FAD-dependent oxidoreductase [Kiritimatiellia bacterium]
MSKKLKVIVVGGVAAGPKAASRILRMRPDADVTIVEKGEFLSYAGCGLPYYVSGVVKEQKELMSTPVGVVRDPVFFSKVKNVHVRNGTEALTIDRANKKIGVAPVGSIEPQEWLEYDKLVLCTGARPVRPPIPGADKCGVYALHEVEDAEGIKSMLAENKAKDVVIVGGGLIGVEMTEALAEHGCRVTVVEKLDQILTML